MVVDKKYQVISLERTEIELPSEVFELQKKLEKEPKNAELWMELGIAYSKAKLMRESVEAFSCGIAADPFMGILYRHRGPRLFVRYLFAEGMADLEIASRMIPDNWDVWYHLGLAHFLMGNFTEASRAYQRCLDMSTKEDELIAVCDWYYMTKLRMGDPAGAAAVLEHIKEDFDPGENVAYFRRLLMYKGVIKPEEVLPTDLNSIDPLDLITMGFGLSNYYFYNGDVAKSNEVIELIIKAGDESSYYNAFGYVAAVVDKHNRAKEA